MADDYARLTVKWTAIASIPLAALSFYLGNVHSGPGGITFLLGLVLLLPTFIVGSMLGHMPSGGWVVATALLQFGYWASWVFLARLVTRRRRSEGAA